MHGVAWPFLPPSSVAPVAARTVCDRARTARSELGPLFVVAFLAVLTHPFLDWLTTYAIALLAPLSAGAGLGQRNLHRRLVVYWLLMIAGITVVGEPLAPRLPRPGGPPCRWRHARLHRLQPRRLARGRCGDSAAGRRGIEPTLIVAGPPPLAFWRRADRCGAAPIASAAADYRSSAAAARLDSRPLGLDDPRLADAARTRPRRPRFPVVVAHAAGRSQSTAGPTSPTSASTAIRSLARGAQIRGAFPDAARQAVGEFITRRHEHARRASGPRGPPFRDRRRAACPARPPPAFPRCWTRSTGGLTRGGIEADSAAAARRAASVPRQGTESGRVGCRAGWRWSASRPRVRSAGTRPGRLANGRAPTRSRCSNSFRRTPCRSAKSAAPKDRSVGSMRSRTACATMRRARRARTSPRTTISATISIPPGSTRR